MDGLVAANDPHALSDAAAFVLLSLGLAVALGLVALMVVVVLHLS